MIPEVQRLFVLDRIGAGATAKVEASMTELSAVAARLGVPSVQALHCAFRLRRIGDGVVEAQGSLTATLTQHCVVSLEEFETTLTDSFTIHFVPAGTEDEDSEPDVPDQLPFEGTSIDLGEAAVEQLALVLDPYPRKPGAALPIEAADSPAGAFAALAALRTTQ